MLPVIDPSRRRLLFGRPREAAKAPLRAPWTRSEDQLLTHCTRCDACVRACPENILVRGDGGYPEIDFSRGECTFCQACVSACAAPVFGDPARTAPWSQVAVIADSCLGRQAIYCRSCGESCEAGAIRFPLAAGRMPVPTIDAEACSGCGACVGVCPASALRIEAEAAS